MPLGKRRSPATCPRSAGLSLLAGILFLGCGAEAPLPVPEGVLSLLQRPLTIRLDTEARVAPTLDKGFGDHDLGGWQLEAKTQLLPPRTFVLTTGSAAALRLAASGPGQRRITVEAWTEGGPAALLLTLNGVELAPQELSSWARSLTFEPPAQAWLTGDNQLDLRLVGEDLAELRLAVEDVRIEPAEQVVTGVGTVRLDPGTSTGWLLEVAAESLFDFELVAPEDPAATAIWTLEVVAPATGARELVEERRVPANSTEPVIGRLLAPPPGEGQLRLTLTWEAPAEAEPLTLTRLDLFEAQPLERPPILFLSIDTLSAWNLSAYGYERPTSPNLERFATDGILFEEARSNAPWTVPSYASQFTGLFADSNKLSPNKSLAEDQRKDGWRYFEIVDSKWTMAEALSAAGYRTAAFVDNLWLARISGFQQGFELFDAEAAKGSHFDDDGGMRQVLPKALAALEAEDPRPPFVFAHMFDVHGPYWPRGDHRGRFSDELDPEALTQLPVAATRRTLFGAIPSTIASGRIEGPVPATYAAEYFQADYDEKIVELDEVLGAFFDDLKERGLYDDLLIVVSADHGESMLDHDFLFGHGLVYDSAIRVPLILKLPGQAHAGLRIAAPVQLVDLYPTLLDQLGLQPERSYLHGRSLLPWIRGAELPPVPTLSQANILDQSALQLGRWKLVVSTPDRTDLGVLVSHAVVQTRLFASDPVLFEATFGSTPPLDPNQIPPALLDLERDDPAKLKRMRWLIRQGGPIVELFDLVADPREEVNLAEERPEQVADLLGQLEELRQEARAAQSLEAAPEVRLTPAMLEELKRLGYLGDD